MRDVGTDYFSGCVEEIANLLRHSDQRHQGEIRS